MRPRILIVDSNRVIRGFIRSILSSRAGEIREAVDGRDAIAQYTNWHPDVVLMEVRMPHMDGLDATRAIRAIDPRALIVIVTDYDVADYRSAAREAGATDYVLKEHLLLLPDLIGDLSRQLHIGA
ncbi:MAG: response regulator [Ignavibacteriae bacterium]|nr:response regulator [Ignavibacteriota bacterium]